MTGGVLINNYDINSVTSIGDYAFKYCDDLTIHGQKDSYAQEYAEEYNIPFVEE